MEIGICNLSKVPVRKEPSDSSEMVTELLFGETFEIIQKSKQWRQVRLHYDNYEGWLDEKMYKVITEAFYAKIKANYSVSIELAQSLIAKDKHIPIVIGSSLPLYDGMNLKIMKQSFVFNGQAIIPGSGNNDKQVLLDKIAHKYLNAPYLWGGRSPFGIDCSGLTQIVYKCLGIPLPRDSYQQAERGETINFIGEAKPGDLAFFSNQDGDIAHTGIILEDKKIMHAYGKVRSDTIDHYGIYNTDRKQYSHKLRIIKRVL